MSAATQPEPATTEPDPAGQLLTGRADPHEPEALTGLGITDQLISLSGWRRRKQSPSDNPARNQAEPDLEARRAAEAQAAVRAQLDDAEARRVQLEQDHAVRVDTLRREAESALAILATELEAHAAVRLNAAVRDAQTEAVRAAAETAQQHEAALTALHAQLDDAEARRVQLEQDHAVRVDTMRQEAEAALAILAKELETQAAEQVAAAVREAQTQAANRLAETTKEHELALANVRTDAQADTAQAEDRLAALTQEFADGVEAQATAQIEVVRATAKTAQQHEAALAAVQAQLDDADARRVQLEQSHAARAYRTARRRQAASGWAA